ncbi:unnamed protein product [Orchesella dallaii]|uniref:PARG catalytic Macro domain-containing protein n=1 Tax=Orchesella dallaii TaxID=48710 RepID=A0ABP1RU69_9HEXA
MFNTSTVGNVKVEKLKCILNYFQQLGPPGQNSEKDHQVISFERRFVEDKTDWASSTTKLIKVVVEPTKRIEEAHGMLQVDFANKIVGGEVFNEGALMEEIRFAIYPELIISRLFTENLKDNEVLAITGAEQFSNYEGYAENFRYTGPSKPLQYEGDHFGRISSFVVAMDALHFSQIEIESQFEQINIDRELHKAYVAFLVPPGEPNTLIATGNWGCGVFNGDVQLKFLIQWVAASEAGRNGMQFHTIGDELLSQDIKAMQDFLIKQDFNIGDLYKAMIGYHAKISEHSCLFNYLVHSITASADSRNDE